MCAALTMVSKGCFASAGVFVDEQDAYRCLRLGRERKHFSEWHSQSAMISTDHPILSFLSRREKITFW